MVWVALNKQNMSKEGQEILYLPFILQVQVSSITAYINIYEICHTKYREGKNQGDEGIGYPSGRVFFIPGSGGIHPMRVLNTQTTYLRILNTRQLRSLNYIKFILIELCSGL